MALARVRIAQGCPAETAGLLQRLFERAEAGGHTVRAIEVLSLQALGLQARGEMDPAITALERALTLAEPGGFVRTFVDEGPSMARLLYQAVSRGTAGRDSVAQYASRLLSAFPVDETERTAPAQETAPVSELIEPLSEREREVLALIAEGLTNPEIAARLFIALNTVKAHAHNIYGKLGVRNRTLAVSKARALGILASV
jgi:LuxR family maltose regulon positive regulatory protein